MTRIIKAIKNRLPFARLLTSTPKTEHKIEEKNPTDIDKITTQENSWAPIAKSKQEISCDLITEKILLKRRGMLSQNKTDIKERNSAE